LILHELTTNALKYGALSAPDGKLFVTWEQDDDGRATILWREKCKIVQPPGADGFGTRLTNVGAMQLQGEVEREYLHDGISAKLTFQLGKGKDA